MKKEKRILLIKAISLLCGIAFLFFLWWVIFQICYANGIKSVPSPEASLKALFDCLIHPNVRLDNGLGDVEVRNTYIGIGYTFLRLLLGFVISIVIGGVLGTLGGLFLPFEYFNKPFLTTLKTIPTVAVVLLLVAISYGPDFGKFAFFIPVILSSIVMIPLIAESFISGIHSVDKTIIDALSVDGERKTFRSLFTVYYPEAFPYILLSSIQSLGLGMKVIIMSEILVGSESKNGIGELIRYARYWMQTDYIAAYSIIAIVIIMLVDFALRWSKKKLLK